MTFELESNKPIDQLNDLLEGMWASRLFVYHRITREMLSRMGAVEKKASDHLERYTRDMLGREIAQRIPHSKRLLRYPEELSVAMNNPELGRHMEARAEVMIVTPADFQRIQDALMEVILTERLRGRSRP